MQRHYDTSGMRYDTSGMRNTVWCTVLSMGRSLRWKHLRALLPDRPVHVDELLAVADGTWA
jgi:hypothetical protein